MADSAPERTTKTCIDAIKLERSMSADPKAVNAAIVEVSAARKRLESGERASESLLSLKEEVALSLRVKESMDIEKDALQKQLTVELQELQEELEERTAGSAERTGEKVGTFVGEHLDESVKAAMTVGAEGLETFKKSSYLMRAIEVIGVAALIRLAWKTLKKAKEKTGWIGTILASVGLAVGASIGLRWCASKLKERKEGVPPPLESEVKRVDGGGEELKVTEKALGKEHKVYFDKMKNEGGELGLYMKIGEGAEAKRFRCESSVAQYVEMVRKEGDELKIDIAVPADAGMLMAGKLWLAELDLPLKGTASIEYSAFQEGVLATLAGDDALTTFEVPVKKITLTREAITAEQQEAKRQAGIDSSTGDHLWSTKVYEDRKLTLRLVKPSS